MILPNNRIASLFAGICTGIFASITAVFLLTACSQAEYSPSSLIAEGASLTLVSDGFSFTEGPASDRQGNVYFTDQPNNKILKWTASTNQVSTFMSPAGRSNGLYFDNEGNLLACADEKNELWLIEPDKKKAVLVDNFESQRLNGPNDMWVDSQGGIYFTDPYYQRPWWSHQSKEIEQENVYYLSPDKKNLSMVASGFVKPNGLIGSADGKTLYVADIGDQKTYQFAIGNNGQLSERTLFTELGSDGMTIDSAGNVYLTGEGVSIFDPKGQLILNIPVPESWTANVTFAGKEQKTLFVTAMDSVYTLDMNVSGIRY